MRISKIGRYLVVGCIAGAVGAGCGENGRGAGADPSGQIESRQAGLTALRGLLALEVGDTSRAEGLFKESLAVIAGPGFGSALLAEYFLKEIKR